MKNIINSLLIIVTTAIVSCNSQKKDNDTITPETLLSKTISFPTNLLKLDSSQFQKTGSFFVEIENKGKIVSIVDGNCMKCIINQLNKIDSIFNSILSDDDNLLIFILNVSKEDSAYFMRNLQPAINTTGVILWDNNYNFERENNLFTADFNLRTFMTNKENKIIQTGNPVMHPDIIFEYKKKLNCD